jgi:hypothetical protein
MCLYARLLNLMEGLWLLLLSRCKVRHHARFLRPFALVLHLDNYSRVKYSVEGEEEERKDQEVHPIGGEGVGQMCTFVLYTISRYHPCLGTQSVWNTRLI